MATVLSFAQHAVPPDVQVQVSRLHDQVWPRADVAVPVAHDPELDPIWMVLVDDHDVVAASLAVLSTTITHRGEHYAVSGLSAVVTDDARRGRGHGRLLVSRARRLIADRGQDLGIFTCNPPLAGFYERAGWQVLPGTMLIGGTRAHPFPSDQFDKLTMAALFSTHARSHAVDFEHAQIELYPGAIDRVW